MDSAKNKSGCISLKANNDEGVSEPAVEKVEYVLCASLEANNIKPSPNSNWKRHSMCQRRILCIL